MTSLSREFCEVCGGREGECSCAWQPTEAAIGAALGRTPYRRDELEELAGRPVFVAGLPARIRRDDDGSFVVTFERAELPPFRARGVPGDVLAAADLHVRATLGR